MTTLHEIHGTAIFAIPGFLSAEECREWIDLSEERGFAFAAVAGAEVPSYRNNSRVNLVDATRANELWERARPFLPVHEDGRRPVGFNDHLKVYRYQHGEQFDWHGDGIVPFDDGRASAYTFLVYLADRCEGGETAFRVRDGDEGRLLFVPPETGTALCFEHRILHRGERVEAGEKYVLRTDVIYGPAS